MNHLLRARIWPSFSPSCRLNEPEAWRLRVFLRQAPRSYARDRQDKLTRRRTVQVRLGLDFGFRISDLGFLTTSMIWNLTDEISLFVLWFLRAFQQIFIPQSAIRIPRSSTRWHDHLRCLATAIHEIAGLPASFSCKLLI